jgi:hypothetical protein
MRNYYFLNIVVGQSGAVDTTALLIGISSTRICQTSRSWQPPE